MKKEIEAVHGPSAMAENALWEPLLRMRLIPVDGEQAVSQSCQGFLD